MKHVLSRMLFTGLIAALPLTAARADNPASFVAPPISLSKPYPVLNVVTPEMYGCSVSASDNTTCLQSAFASGRPVYLGGMYRAFGPIAVSGCPSIYANNSATQGITITGVSGGLAITCPVTTNVPTSGHVYLSNFGIYTSAAEINGTGALSITFSAQTPGTLAIPTLDMQYLHIGGTVPASFYFTNLVTVTNGQSMNFIGNWLTGHYGAYADTTNGFLITNAAGAPAMVNTFWGNSVYQAQYGYHVLATAGASDLEGMTFHGDVAITNDYGFVIDASAASDVSPGWGFNSVQTNSAVAAISVSHAAQVWIGGSELYVNGAASNGVVVSNSSNTVSLGNDNIIINVAGGATTGSGIKVTGSGPGQIGGGTIQNFAKGIDLDGSSTQWIVLPAYYNSVTTPISNAGSSNTILTRINSGKDLALNGNALIPPTMSGDEGDASVVIDSESASIIRFNTALTADRSVTFTGSFTPGQTFTVVRQAGATGAHNVGVVGDTTANMSAAKQWTMFQYDGANMIQVGGGILY